MKTCPNCNELVGDNADVCFNCNYNFKYGNVVSRETIQKEREKAEREAEEINKKIEEERKRKEELENAIKNSKITKENMMKTTGFGFDGYKIVEYCGIVTDTAMYSLGMMTEFKNAVDFKAMVAGKEFKEFSQKTQEFVNELMNDLALTALYKNANALIGVSYNCVPHWNANSLTLMITMSATAVYIEKE